MSVRGGSEPSTPITYAHVSVSPGARLQLPWRSDFNALVYVLSGHGAIGSDGRPFREGQLAGAGLDVVKPLPSDHPLWNMPGLLITPHVAGRGPYLEDRRSVVLGKLPKVQ